MNDKKVHTELRDWFIYSRSILRENELNQWGVLLLQKMYWNREDVDNRAVVRDWRNQTLGKFSLHHLSNRMKPDVIIKHQAIITETMSDESSQHLLSNLISRMLYWQLIFLLLVTWLHQHLETKLSGYGSLVCEYSEFSYYFNHLSNMYMYKAQVVMYI